jgi:hypothetical protein
LKFAKAYAPFALGQEVQLSAAGYHEGEFLLKLSNFCPKCGKVLCVCLSLVVGAAVPVIEAINLPPEECQFSAPCSFGDLWAPHGKEHDYGASHPAIEPVAEMGGGAAATAPLSPWGWEDAANGLPPAYRYPRRRAAINQPDDSAWMGPLTLKSISWSA